MIFKSHNKPKNNLQGKERVSGFTLIETLIYIVLFAVVIGGGMVSVYNIIEGTSANYNHVILREEANFLMRKIHWALTGITAIGVGPSTLSTTKIISGMPTQILITIDGSTMTLARASGSPLPLNASSIAVSDLAFTDVEPAGGRPQGVTASFTLTTAQNGRPASQDFSTIKYLRK